MTALNKICRFFAGKASWVTGCSMLVLEFTIEYSPVQILFIRYLPPAF
jgi:hypothetical protein